MEAQPHGRPAPREESVRDRGIASRGRRGPAKSGTWRGAGTKGQSVSARACFRAAGRAGESARIVASRAAAGAGT